MKKWLKIIVILLLVLAYGFILTHRIDLATSDLGRHLTNGKLLNWEILKTNYYSYTQPGRPFLNHHWLSGVFFYYLFLLTGFKGLVVFKVIVLLAAFLLVFHLAVKKGGFWPAALFALPTIILLGERTDVRPEIFSFLFIALFLYILILHPKKIFWLIPLQLIWVNCHIYFPIGILMTGGYLFSEIIRKKPVKKLSFVLLLLILVSLINPAGFNGLIHPLNIFQNYGYLIVENQSPFFLQNLMQNPAISFFKVISFLLIISFLFNLDNFSVFWFLASAAVVIGGGKMIRNFPLIGLIGLPAMSINYASFLKKISKAFPLILMVTIFFTIRALPEKTRGLGLTFQSNDSAEFYKENNLHGPIFNNYDIGSYLIWHLNEKVFVDNRPEAYTRDFFEQIYKPMQSNDEEWEKRLEEYNFNVIFFTHQESTPWGRTFIAKRIQDWPLIYADSQAVIFLRDIPENKEIIGKYRITPENIAERIAPLINSEDEKVKLSAINLLKLMKRYDLALEICRQLEPSGRTYLEMASAEMGIGTETEILAAKRHLEKAIELGEKLPSVYNQLGLLYFNLGEYEEAKKAWEKASDETAEYYLKQYRELNLP